MAAVEYRMRGVWHWKKKIRSDLNAKAESGEVTYPGWA